MTNRKQKRSLLLLLSLFLVNIPIAIPQYQHLNPWSAENIESIVRIESTIRKGSPPEELISTATGFVVEGFGGKRFVITSTHGVLPEWNGTDPLPSDCSALPNDPKFFQTNRGGDTLTYKCAVHLGNDVSLIELEPGKDLPTLDLLACDIKTDDTVFLAGFALAGNLDTTLAGRVRGNGPKGMIRANILTAEGLSGGPYVTANGRVVGIHRGGALFTAGYAHMVPIHRVSGKLEIFMPSIEKSNQCPNPAALRPLSRCRVCVRETTDGSFCDGTKPYSCSGWSDSDGDIEWSDEFIHKSGGTCAFKWRLECE